MIRTRISVRSVALAWLSWPSRLAEEAQERPADHPLTVKAGRFDRDHTPVRFEIPETRLGPEVRKALDGARSCSDVVSDPGGRV